jgi:hypothetical protein
MLHHMAQSQTIQDVEKSTLIHVITIDGLSPVPQAIT